MKQELNVLDYKFGLESMESACPPGETGIVGVSTATVQATDASSAIASSAIASSAAINSPGAVYSEIGAASAPFSIGDPQTKTPAVVSQSGIRKRVAPSRAPTDDTNELIAAITASKSVIQPIQTESLPTPFNSPQSIAPYAVAPATTTDTTSSFAVASSSTELESKPENELTLTPENQHQFPTEWIKTADSTATPPPSNRIAGRAVRDQEARALFSIQRGIKIFAVLGSLLLLLIVYETTKQGMFRNVADCAAAMGASSVALNIFDSELAKEKSSVAILTAWANKDQWRGRMNNAVMYYTRAIALDPKDYLLYVERGSLSLDLHRPKAAIADASRAISLNSNCALAYYNRGLAYRSEGNYNQALMDYDKAIALSSARPPSSFWLNRGACYLQMRRFKEAIQDFDLAIRHGSQPAVTLKEIAISQAKHMHRLEAKVNSTHRHHHS